MPGDRRHPCLRSRIGRRGAPRPALKHGAEATLRRHTHRGDQFVWLDDLTLVIVAVANSAGLEAMSERLRGVVGQAGLNVHLVSAVFPVDGETPERLLEAAARRSPEPSHMGLHATVDSSGQERGGR